MGLGTLSSLEIKVNGEVKEQKIRTAPFFYISEDGFKHSHSAEFTEKHLASYVHEFNHFVLYALQKVPIELIRIFLTTATGMQNMNITDYAKRLLEEDIPNTLKSKQLILAMYSSIVKELHENSTRILDKMVLSSIGIEVPLPWRGKEREYESIPLPTRQIMIVPIGGDPFINLEDKEVVERTIDWEQYFNPMMRSQYLDNFIQSVKELKVSRVSIQELKKDLNRRPKRRNR